MIDDDLRDLMPAERRLPPHRKRQLKERLMHDIETHDAPIRGRRPSRRLTGGLVAAAVLATSGAAAAAIGFGGPDPEQAAQVIENNTEEAKVHLDGWRPVLRSEFVACIGPDSNKLTDPRETGTTPASEFPLEDNLTAALLIEECASGNDWARNQGGYDQQQATACVRDGDFLLAVVALEGLDCADTGHGVRPITDDDLARLNEMRALEVAVLANPDQCPTLDEAVDWTRARVEEHGEQLNVRGVAGSNSGCYGSTTYWERGEVIVEQHSGPITPTTSQDQTTSTTAPPSAPAADGDN